MASGNDRLKSDGLPRAGFSGLVLAYLVSGVLVGALEWQAYGRGGLMGLACILGFVAPFALGLGLVLGLPAIGLGRLLRRGLPSWDALGERLLSDRLLIGLYWFLFLLLFFMAFVPYPVFTLLGGAASPITDAALQIRFSSSASILAIALSLAISGVLTLLSFLLLVRFGLLTLQPSFPLFWIFAFPFSWLLIPMLVVCREGEAMASAARLLLPLLLAAMGPGLAWPARYLPRFGRVGLALLLAAAALVLAGLVAVGSTFQAKAISRSPLASLLYDSMKDAADLDGDGLTLLFDGQDCDEFDARVNRMALDRPGNGIDEDCDGADSEAEGGLQLDLGGEEPFPFEGRRRFNVILVIIDALRADHVHSFGYKRGTTPNFDRLAQVSLTFTNAISQYPSTGISFPSFLAGMYPEFMKWGKPTRQSDVILLPGNVLISDLLAGDGYVTHSIVNAWIERNIKGLKEHFDTQVPLYPHSEWKSRARDSAAISATKAIEFLERRDDEAPFFLMVHFEGPHEPYVNHDAPGRVFGKRALDRYDSDVYWADLWFGFLLGYLEEKGFLEETVLFVFSDHGEEFNDHGNKYHGHQIFQESIHVPLLVHIPGQAGMTIAAPVALIDIVPTILDLTGLTADRSKLQGVSLLWSALGPPASPGRPIFSMLADREKHPTYRCKAVLHDGMKLIANLTDGEEHLFDLRKDPREKHDLARKQPRRRQEMSELLKAFLQGGDASWKLY